MTIDHIDEETWYDQQDIDKDKGIGSDLVFTFKEDVKKNWKDLGFSPTPVTARGTFRTFLANFGQQSWVIKVKNNGHQNFT